MELRQVLRDLRQNVGVALAALVLCVVVGGAAAFLPKAHYQASVQVLIQPAPNSQATDAIPVIQTILPQLPTEATDSTTLAKARELLVAAGPGRRCHRLRRRRHLVGHPHHQCHQPEPEHGGGHDQRGGGRGQGPAARGRAVHHGRLAVAGPGPVVAHQPPHAHPHRGVRLRCHPGRVRSPCGRPASAAA